MDYQKELNIVRNYRENLLNSGKHLTLYNPDHLQQDEVLAITAEIFEQINKIDMELYKLPYHETNIKRPKSISDSRFKELFTDFIDWYQVIPTPSQAVLDYVLKNYSKSDFHNILCVGDGEKSHLSRKLAMHGYHVISIDPFADTNLPLDKEIQSSSGSFLAKKGIFSSSSSADINWANLIVGSKIPTIVEDILQVQNKPAVFTISTNADRYNMKFQGVPIWSHEQFTNLIKSQPNIKTSEFKQHDDDDSPITVFEKTAFQITRHITDSQLVTQKINNLNDLSKEQLQKLEQYAVSQNDSLEIQAFFNSLKSGDLQDKTIEIDALDFVCDGLSELIEEGLHHLDTKNTPTSHDEI